MKTPVLLAVLLLLPASMLNAAASDEASARMPDEITVTGQQLFRVLEQRIMEAEDKMYALYNELNDEDILDIHCRWEVPQGTRIRQRVCRPEFLSSSERKNGQDYLARSQGFGTNNQPPIASEMAYYYPQLEAKMKAIIQESPELLEAITEHHELRETLAERKTTYFGKE